MRSLKRFGVALAMLVAVGVAMASTASAVLDPEFLFPQQAFTASGGAGALSVLENPFSITCTLMTATGNLGGDPSQTFTATIDFTGCNANSLGDPAKTILFKVDGLLCWINEAKLEVGLYILATEDVHLENVSLIGLLVFLKGSADVAALTPDGVKTKTLTAKLETNGTNGDQKVPSCLDLGVTLKPEILVQQNEAGAEKMGAIKQDFTITPAAEGLIDD